MNYNPFLQRIDADPQMPSTSTVVLDHRFTHGQGSTVAAGPPVVVASGTAEANCELYQEHCMSALSSGTSYEEGRGQFYVALPQAACTAAGLAETPSVPNPAHLSVSHLRIV